MGKVAIVGVEGSGKTVLMAGLCECFKQNSGSDDPYLMPENQAAFKFMETVPYMLRVKHQWPAATGIDNLRAMRWTYRCGNEVLETIELLDYPGELYRLAFGDAEEVRKEELESKRDEVKKFLDHLIDADTLLVLLNLSDILNLGENHRNLETVWITRGILSYAKRLSNIKHTVLVFTQADRYAQELKASGGPEGLYAKKLPMLKTLFPKQEVMAVAAVNGTDEKGNPNERYSSDGCQAIMRCILAETEKEILTSLSLCEKGLNQIETFNSGNPIEFYCLVESFSTHVGRLVEVAKPFGKYYSGQIKGFERDANRLSALARDLKHFVENRNLASLASAETWTALEKNYSDVDLLFVHFRRYFLEKNKKHDEKTKEETKSLFTALSVAGVVIALVIGLSIKGARDAEQSRLLKVKNERIEAEQKQEAENRGKQAEIRAKVERERLELEKKLEDERKAKIKREERERLESELKVGDQTSITLGNGVKLDLVWCPAASFMMGSPEGEEGRMKDETQHHVTLTKGFWMGRTEVTQAQWKEVMGDNPSHTKGLDLPVECVSWWGCKEFAEKVNKRMKESTKVGVVRLPTEAEWEYACRAGTRGAYAGNLDDIAWHSHSSRDVIHDVGRKQPNAFGLYDMHGNVSEWCQDFYGTYPSGSVTDPQGSTKGSRVVARGGSYCSSGSCRSAKRGFPEATYTVIDIGFRVAADLP
jgi:formylglycine-generating enzyme required for sulfatase activity